jgi:hypothetical protein
MGVGVACKARKVFVLEGRPRRGLHSVSSLRQFVCPLLSGGESALDNEAPLMSAKVRELMIKASLLTQRTDGQVRLLKESSSSQNNKAESDKVPSTLRVRV